MVGVVCLRGVYVLALNPDQVLDNRWATANTTALTDGLLIGGGGGPGTCYGRDRQRRTRSPAAAIVSVGATRGGVRWPLKMKLRARR